MLNVPGIQRGTLFCLFMAVLFSITAVFMLGPGGGTSGLDRRYFNPEKYKIVLFDQRGSGKSTPHAVLEGNDTFSLVEDIEKIRNHLGIDKWIVFGMHGH
jgi:proline iminopeptidase